MRLTRKINDEYITDDTKCMKNKYINKLGQLEDSLEDFEDKYGIDLITLFKALENGIYFKRENDIHKRDINYICKDRLGYRGYSLGAYDDDNSDIDIYFWFKDYGKTWALTREELL